jgi:ABC-type uncharacterized transport system involved in gliding motility auxiliary subunit
MTQKNSRSGDQALGSKKAFLWAISIALVFAMMFARLVYPEYLWLTVGVAVLLVISLGSLLHFNRKALQTRSAAYGLNSAITVLLVIAIVGVLDFLTSRYPYKIDLTKNKIHTLSDQTKKVVKGLQTPVKATLFAKLSQREQVRPLLENYKALSTKFELEFVDPDREPTRTKEAGIKKYGTLHLQMGTRESNIDDLTEEKLTNALIKLVRDKVPALCAIVGHGERSFSSTEADGYASMKKSLTDQSYEVKDVNLLQEGKLPESCNGIVIIGPTKSFFPPEIKALSNYLSNGGRAIVALDINVKGGEFAPELLALLKDWYVKADQSMIIDTVSRQFGVDASAPVVASYSKTSPITKDFQLQNVTVFPFLRPLEILPGAPASLKPEAIAMTTPNSLQVTDLKQIASGAVAVDPSKTKAGPFNAVITVEGKQKDSKAARDTRIVVLGSSNLANNNWSRYASNSDFFLNSVGWIMEDESMISIRAKDEGPSIIEISQKQGVMIGFLTIGLIPALIAAAGIIVWAMRKKM